MTKENEKLYTAYIVNRRPVTKNGVTEERDVLVVYYDVTWEQVGFYMKKHGAQDASVEEQTKKLNKLPETSILDDIVYTEAAIRGTKEAKNQVRDVSGIPAGGTKPVVETRRTLPGSKVAMNADYSDLVNVIVNDAA